jgi:hypothetical protein
LGGGGSGKWEQGHGIAVDGQGNAYLSGLTYSSNFPTESPIQPAYGGGGDGFVAIVRPSVFVCLPLVVRNY